MNLSVYFLRCHLGNRIHTILKYTSLFHDSTSATSGFVVAKFARSAILSLASTAFITPNFSSHWTSQRFCTQYRIIAHIKSLPKIFDGFS